MELNEAEQKVVRQALSTFVDRMEGIASDADIQVARDLMEKLPKED